MTEPNVNDVKKGGDGTPDPGTSKDKKTEPSDGETPVTTKQMKELSDKVDHSAEVTENLSNALKEERGKRQKDKTKIEELEGLLEKSKSGKYDEGELKEFVEAGKAAKFVTEDDLRNRDARKEVESIRSGNQKTLNSFLKSNKKLFGSDTDADEKQNANWATFTKYIEEVFDINKDNILSTIKLGIKLDAAVAHLSAGKGTAAAREQGASDALVDKENADLLKVGSGAGGSGDDGGDGDTLPHGTPKAEAVQILINSGYKEDYAHELVYKKKKS